MHKFIRIILGAPCTGKGSQSALLSKKYGWKHVSAGDLLRKNYGPETKERQSMDEGNLIAINDMNRLIEHELLRNDFNVILDGYPRSIGQAEFLIFLLNKYNVSIREIVVLIECSKEELMRRTSLRTICFDCGTTFSSIQICCEQKTKHRNDDKLEVLYKRYDLFSESLAKIQSILQGPFYFVNCRQPIDQIFNNICKIIDHNKTLEI
jgi:adenylate kinase